MSATEPVPPASPPLFVAVNSSCNLTCWYCTKLGENRSAGRHVSSQRLAQIFEVAYERGVRTFRFTGGEPTLRLDIGEILLAAQALGDDVRIAMTTNGVRLDRVVDVIEHLREPRLFISVDGIDKTLPRGGRGKSEFLIEKWLTPKLEKAIDSVRPFAALRLNYVLTRSSEPQLPALIDYASSRGFDVKIFELLLRDFYYAGHRPRVDVFEEQYLSVRQLLPSLRRSYGTSRPFGGTGGRGIPMFAFDAGSSQIVYFDSAVGSHYGDVCHACPHFPCQEGLYALVLDANGMLHPAGCVNKKLHVPLAVAGRAAIEEAFDRLQGTIDASTLQPAVPEALLSASSGA